MRASHTSAAISACFDDKNLIGSAGLVPAAELMDRIGFRDLSGERVKINGVANGDLKVSSLVLGMIAGADSIDDVGILRHGAMGKVFAGVRAPSTLGTFLRAFTFGHVGQLEAVATATATRLIAADPSLLPGFAQRCVIDIDDTIKPVYGIGKQGSEHGYRGLRGLSALVATVSAPDPYPRTNPAHHRRQRQ